jgi:nucleotide-binding universal stress UspA family protein
MTYAAILVHVQAADEGRPRLDCAVGLAKMFDATLIGLAAEMIPPLVPAYGFYAVQGGWFEAMRESVEDNLAGARKLFDTASAGLVKPTIFESGIRMPASALTGASRAADLIVTNRIENTLDDSYRNASPAELVVLSGRPVLIAPNKAAGLVGDRVVIAWKDTREARRAMADAMPFFKRAKEVLVLEICGKDAADDARIRTEDVAGALARHGVSATAKVVVGAASGAQVLQQAKAFDADLVVAGGYGHSRLGEWVFGGVTQDLLDQDEQFVLLSH